MSKRFQSIDQQYQQLTASFHPDYLKHAYQNVEQLEKNFAQYVWQKYHVQVISLGGLQKVLHKTVKNDNPKAVYLINSQSHYRPLKIADLRNFKQIYKAYFLYSNEFSMHLFLLFNSNLGTRYLSHKFNIPFTTMSKIRHYKESYKDLPIDKILALENYCLNSKIAKHIRRQKIRFQF